MCFFPGWNLSAVSGFCLPRCPLAHTPLPREGRESAPGCAPGRAVQASLALASALLGRCSFIDCTSHDAEVVPLGGSLVEWGPGAPPQPVMHVHDQRARTAVSNPCQLGLLAWQ